jgi:hypothetical protein
MVGERFHSGAQGKKTPVVPRRDSREAMSVFRPFSRGVSIIITVKRAFRSRSGVTISMSPASTHILDGRILLHPRHRYHRNLWMCMDVKSTSCGIFNVTTATASCPAWHQHAACWQDYLFGSCTQRCECENGPAQTPPQPDDWIPRGHWDVITFTSSNSPFNGYHILTTPSGQQYQMQDAGAPPLKLAQDVQFACINVKLSCPLNSDTVAIPFDATLFVEATITRREVNK